MSLAFRITVALRSCWSRGLFLVCLGMLVPNAGAATFYVSPSGADTNDGSSWQAAKKTVAAGLAGAASGDQVWVAAGVYAESFTLNSGIALYGGFAGNETDLSHRDWVANSSIVEGTITVAAGAAVTTRIDGFTVRKGANGIYCSSNALATIINNTLTETRPSRAAIYCYNSSPTILNNIITGNDGGGISCHASTVVSGNVITRNTGTGITCGESSIVSNNVVVQNASDGISCSGAASISNNKIIGNTGRGIYCSTASSSQAISNNTIVGNGGSGIHCDPLASPRISNNIIAFNGFGVYRDIAGSPVLRSNCVYNPGTANYSGVSPGEGDISVDPQLLGAPYGEAHLSATSPCIDAGDDTYVSQNWLDMDGEPRIQGVHVDMGADEFNGTPPAFTTHIVRVRTSGSDANDGSSWLLAKQTIQAGIDAASIAGGGEVWVAAGVYNERIVIKPWIHLYGGFNGTEDARDDRDWVSHRSVVDGGAAGTVITVPAGSCLCTIDGFLIRNGVGTSSMNTRYGGGLSCDKSLVTIANNTITQNFADNGGGIYCSGGLANVWNNVVTANSALSYGGGIYCDSPWSAITNNTVVGNAAKDGGGVWCGRSATVVNNLVAFNSSGIYGSSYLTPTLRKNCVYNPGSYDYSGLVAGTGDFSADPQILTKDYGQVHLLAGSPCIDAGDNAAVRAGHRDMDGELRKQGEHVDIGADEFNGTSPAPFIPTIIRVSTSGNDLNDGSSWDSAKQSVQAAVDAACEAGGGEVWVAGGTYQKIEFRPWVYLYGGFAGTESSRDQRDWVTNVTALDGGAKGSVISVRCGYRIGRIDGFTIRNGTGTPSSGGALLGGGLYCPSSPVITNNTITANSGLGAVYCSPSSAVISNNVISSNAGSGIVCTGSLVISGNTIADNAGTGIASSGPALMSNNTIRGHSYSGISSTGPAIILNNTITGNRSGNPFSGGGITTTDSPTILNNRIEGNVATSGGSGSGGGGIYCNAGSPVISNNTLIGNNAAYGQGGGGISCGNSSSPVISNNTIVGNVALDGGGICIGSYASAPVICNNIVAFNSSGIARVNGTPTLRNNCVYNPGSYNYSGLAGGTGDILADPRMRAEDYGQVHLLAGSPCIDGGDDAWVPAGHTDMDGEPRRQGTHVDIGADEFSGTISPFSPAVVRVSGSGDDANDGSSWVLAKRTVQSAIETVSAAGGGEIWVAAGTFNERITVKPWCYLYGGFAGTEISRDQRDRVRHVTVLDGGAGGSVVSALSAGGTCGVDGFTIRNGTGTLSTSYRYGGGIYCHNSSMRIVHNTIVSNSATYGGGVSAVVSWVMMSGNTVAKNSAWGYGGGVYCSSAPMTISNNIIDGNSTYGVFGVGGGICSYYSPSVITNNWITSNTAGSPTSGGSGGGLGCYGSPIVSNNTVVGNYASGYGGGIWCNNSPVISNNIVAFNSSGIYGSKNAAPLLRNNCFYNLGTANYSGVNPGEGDISEDPGLLGGAYGEVHLTAGSPCIDAGYDAAVLAGHSDIDGQLRIQGQHVDIGADEFDGATPTHDLPIIRVSIGGDNANDGSSWALAKRTVQAAINAASESGGGEVWVAAGTYIERITLVPGAFIYGGFAGIESSRDQRNRVDHPTILDGGAAGSVVSISAGGYRTCRIDGFTIRNGTGTLSNGARYGGGIYCNGAAPDIVNNIITGNSATDGAGIYSYYGSPGITNNAIRGNVASGAGGGIYSSYSSFRVTNCVLAGNSANVGGGLYSFDGEPVLINCTIGRNSAKSGSGVYSRDTNPILTNCIVWGNQGTAIYTYGGTPAITYSNIQGGHAGAGNIAADPQFVPRSANLCVSPGSPCIDAGDNTAVPLDYCDLNDNSDIFEPTPRDVAGKARFIDDPQTSDTGRGNPPIVDMGACEYDPSDFDSDEISNDVDNCPFVANFDQCDMNGDGRGDACEHPAPNIALLFDGLNDAALIPHHSAYDFAAGDFTLELWFRTPGPGYLVDKRGEGAGGAAGFFVRVETDGLATFGVVVSSQQNSAIVVSSASPVTDDRWHHLAGIRTGNQIKLLIDNGPAVVQPVPVSLNVSNTAGLVLGNSYTLQNPFTGAIDDLRLWSVARTDEQVLASLYASLIGQESELVGYFALDGGCTQQTLTDSASRANHGSLGSSADQPDASDPEWILSSVTEDHDGDGALDLQDSCPETYNPDQLDSDNDGIGDACDNCPAIFNPEQADLDRDRIGDACDPDMDQDSIENEADNCPTIPNPGQDDSDLDHVGNACDACPDTAPNTIVDAEGCPVPIRADFDGDTDVDQEDFGHLQACMSGPSTALTDPACANADLDNDSDVDQNDVSIFSRCVSGPSVPGVPSCAP